MPRGGRVPGSKNKKPPKETGIIYTRVPKAIEDAIVKRAERNARSKNGVVVLMLATYLKEHPEELMEITPELLEFANGLGIWFPNHDHQRY